MRDSLIGNAYRIEQSIAELGDARYRIATAEFGCNGLRDHGTKAIEVHDPGQPLGKGSRGRHHGVGQRQLADLHRHVYHEMASFRSKTGPSQQTRRLTVSPSTEKLRT